MTSSGEPVKVKVTDFKCSKTQESKFPKKSFYIKITVEKETQVFKTSRVKGGESAPSWDGNYFFGDNDLTRSSKICIEMFQRRYFRKNKRIGGFEDTIESLLKDGASEVSRELRKADSDVPSPVNVTFSISTLPKDADIIHLRAGDGIAQARTGVSGMQGPPPILEDAEALASMAGKAVETAKSFNDVWGSLITTLTVFTEITEKLGEFHLYAKTACTILSVIPEIIIAQKNRDDAVYHLMETINDVHLFIKGAKPLESIESHREVFVALGSLTVECAYLIRDYSMDTNFWKRIAKLTWSSVESKIKQYEDKFKDLKGQFQESALVNIDIVAMRCLREVENISEKIKNIDTSLIFNDLPYAAEAGFSPDKSCIRGTRKAALNEIHQWINAKDRDDAGQILVLTGDAGVGKSAIANTIAQHYDTEKHLGSFVSFNRADQARRNPGNLLSTVARDIADLDPYWKSALYDGVKDSHSLRTTTSPTLQMKSFVLEPAKALAIVGPIVIVIDALDESGDASTRKPLLKALAENASKLPRNFRILITARLEDDIRKLSEKLPNIQQQTIKTTDKAMDADITTYVTKELLEFEEDLEGNSRCSNGKGVNMLVKGSGHLFEWAATACRVIQNRRKGSSPAGVLLGIVDNGGDLDELYARILRQTFDDKAMPGFRRVLGGILAAKEPLPMASHSAIQRSEGEEEDIVSMIVGSLGSLLHGVDRNESPQVSIRARHTSFFDFLTDEKRSQQFFVDATKQDRNLVLGCLRVMKKELRFNICGLETSHLRNTDVPDLPALVQAHITPHLLYACRFFGVHLKPTPLDDKRVGIELKDFLHGCFLYWLEVLSLTKLVNTASISLSSIVKWSQGHNAGLAAFAKDAKMFVNVFAPAISQSAPHIYLSALPFAPTQSLVSQQYLPKYSSTIHLKSGSVPSWPAALKTLEGHKDQVRAVAYSPDGAHIVSGSEDKTIRIWDAETGEAVGEPLRGHTGQIMSIAYSPDSRHIVSGSWDKTIRIWDAETGESVGEPLSGHIGAIWAIACSPDETHIVSGSADNTIRVWDAVTGEAVGKPLRGHTRVIYVVAYSPDGKHIVSCSSDETIRIWDAETGEAVGEPLRGHTGEVTSIAYSPDGRHVVSCSADESIRIWSAETGKPIGKPIHPSASENTYQLHSVAWSPNGKHIVSGWHDGMIRVWDAETGEAIGEPFEGHTSQVNSVAYSPDGAGIVSCSVDGTVRVWNAEKSEAAGAQVAENTSEWNFVAYSPGGTRIVSASEGGMICVWDAETGRAVTDPLQGDIAYGYAIATTFSSDSTRIISCNCDGAIQTWDSETGQSARDTIKLDRRLDRYTHKTAAAFSSDGTHIAVQESDEAIRVFDAETGMAMGMSFGKDLNKTTVECIAYPPEGTHIALGHLFGTEFWDPETGNEVGEPSDDLGLICSIAYSPDGKRLVSGSRMCDIYIWNAETHCGGRAVEWTYRPRHGRHMVARRKVYHIGF